MSVLVETSLGDIVIDLLTKECPKTTTSFLKCMFISFLLNLAMINSCIVCKIKYYNNCKVYDLQKYFVLQTGDPTNTGNGGESIYGYVQSTPPIPLFPLIL